MLREIFPQLHIFRHDAAHPKGPFNCKENLFLIKGFHQVIRSPEPEGIHSRFKRCICSDKDHRTSKVPFFYLPQEPNAIQSIHFNISDNEIKRFSVKQREGLVAARCLHDIMSLGRKHNLQDGPNPFLVIYNQYMRHCAVTLPYLFTESSSNKNERRTSNNDVALLLNLL